MSKYTPETCWAFAWERDQPYITTIVAFRRKDLIREVEKFMGDPWKRTYRQGGRDIKVTIQQKD